MLSCCFAPVMQAAPRLPGGARLDFDLVPDDGTPARNHQDSTESIKNNTTETKRKEAIHKWELRGKCCLGTGLLTRLRLAGKFTSTDKSIMLLSWRGGEDRTLLPN